MKLDWDIKWKITKEDRAGRVIEVVRFEDNGLTTLGRNFILNAILGTATTDFSTDPYLGVGNGTDPFDVAQQDLQGTVKDYVSCSNAFISGDKILWDSLFDFPPVPKVWAEFAIFDAQSIPGTNFITDFGFGTNWGAPSDPTGGTFTLTSPNFGGPMGGDIPFDIDAAGLTALLDGFLGGTNTLVTDLNVGFPATFEVELTGIYGQGGLGSTPWADWTIDGSNLTGPDAPYTASMSPVQPGSAPFLPLMLNRRVANLGTQPTSQRWRLNTQARLVG